jgi:hypothetical protein
MCASLTNSIASRSGFPRSAASRTHLKSSFSQSTAFLGLCLPLTVYQDAFVCGCHCLKLRVNGRDFPCLDDLCLFTAQGHITEEERQMENEYRKMCRMPLALKENHGEKSWYTYQNGGSEVKTIRANAGAAVEKWLVIVAVRMWNRAGCEMWAGVRSFLHRRTDQYTPSLMAASVKYHLLRDVVGALASSSRTRALCLMPEPCVRHIAAFLCSTCSSLAWHLGTILKSKVTNG